MRFVRSRRWIISILAASESAGGNEARKLSTSCIVSSTIATVSIPPHASHWVGHDKGKHHFCAALHPASRPCGKPPTHPRRAATLTPSIDRPEPEIARSFFLRSHMYRRRPAVETPADPCSEKSRVSLQLLLEWMIRQS